MDRTKFTAETEQSEANPSAGRRRFLGHASKMAPAAILTLNGGAAMAQSKASAVLTELGPVTLPYDTAKPIGSREEAEVEALAAAERNGFAIRDGVDKVDSPLCIRPSGRAADGTQFKSGDKVELDTQGFSRTQFAAGGANAKGGKCTNGFLVKASSFMSFQLNKPIV